MSTDSPEARFARWRRTGDPAELGAVFDALAPRLLGLALHLCGDPVEAEDVLQSTCLTAIERAATWDEKRPLAPWLSGILTHRAQQALESRERAPQPERVRAPRADQPAEHAEAREIVEILRTRTAEFPPDARTLLLLRLEHGLSPVEIAEALGRSPGTVRVQLQRALARLKRVWPASLTLSLGLAALPSRGLAAVRAAVIEHASTLAPLASGAASSAALAGLLAMKKLSLALAVVLCGALAWWIVDSAGGNEVRRESAAITDASPESVRPAQNERIARGAVEGEVAASAPAASATPPSAASLELEVVWARDGLPAVDVGLALERELGAFTRLHRREARTDEKGRARFEDLDAGIHRLELDRCQARPEFSIRAGSHTAQRIEIPAGVDVQGVVLTRDGVAVPDAEIHLSSPPEFAFGRRVGRSDTQGAFRLLDVEIGSTLTALAAGWMCSRRSRVESATTEPIRVELRLTRPSIAIRGRIRDVQGAPVPGAEIVSGGVMQARHYKEILDHYFVSTTRSDAEGRFRLLDAGDAWIELWASAPGFAPLHVRRATSANGPIEDIEIELQRGSTLEGTLRDPFGAPVVGGGVKIVPVTLLGGYHNDLNAPAWIELGATSDASGVYRIDNVPLGDFVARAALFPLRAKAELISTDGEKIRWDPTLDRGGEIRGRVVDDEGRGVPGLKVVAALPGGHPDRERAPSLKPATTDSIGGFTIERCEAEALDVQVHHPADALEVVLASLGDVVPDGPPIELRVPNQVVPASFLRGRALEADGTPLEAWVTVHCGASSGSGKGSPEGLFEIGPLQSGSYLVMLGRPARGWGGIFGPFEVEAGEHHDLGDLRLAAAATLEIELVDANGKPTLGLMPLLSRIEGGFTFTPGISDENGRVRRDDLPPGEYLLGISRSGCTIPAGHVHLEAASTTTLRLGETRDTRVAVAWKHPTRGRAEHFSESLFGSDGGLIWRSAVDHSSMWLPKGKSSFRLPPGTYRFVLESEAGLRGETEIAVPLVGAGTIELEVELRAAR